jgi:DNA-binding GntR family transcriptional regulator
LFTKNGIPLYVQLKEKLKIDIKNNYNPNDRIPSEGDLVDKYHVSRITVRKAIEVLESENIVEKRHGYGTFVKEKTVTYDANIIGSLTQRLKKQNRVLTTKTKSFEIIEKDEVHFAKELLGCDTLLVMKRTRLLEGEPFALMTNYFDVNSVPDLAKKFNLESLYSFIKEEYGIILHSSEETIESVAADAFQAEQLEIEVGKPLLSLKRLSYNDNEKPIEYSHLLLKANMYKHKIKLVNE